MKKTDYAKLKRVSGNKHIPEIYRTAYIKNGYARTTDLELTVSVPVNITGEGVVDLEDLSIPFDKGWIENDTLYLDRNGNISKSILPYKTHNFPEQFEKDTKFTNTTLFREINTIKKTVWFTSNDDLKPNLQGVFIDSKNKKAVATNAQILVHENLKTVFEKSILLPKDGVKLLNDKKMYNVMFTEYDGNSNVQDTSDVDTYKDAVFIALDGSEIISMRLIYGKYPNWIPVIPKTFNTNVKVNRTAFENQIKIASKYASNHSKLIQFEIDENIFKVIAEDLDYNKEYSSEIKGFSFSGDAISVAFNYTYLLTVLKHYKNEKYVEIDFVNNCTGAIFDQNILVMPLLLNK